MHIIYHFTYTRQIRVSVTGVKSYEHNEVTVNYVNWIMQQKFNIQVVGKHVHFSVWNVLAWEKEKVVE